MPDPSFLASLIERARSGVSITILVPGWQMDHDMLSFEYLDEINIAVRDVAFARDWQTRHDADLARSVELLPSWHRSAFEKTLAWLVWTLAGPRWALRFGRPRARAFLHS